MPLDEWKRQYSNNDTPVATKWLWENIDLTTDYSIWKVDYKYNDELTKLYMSNNLAGGLMNRLERARKYAFGCLVVAGEDNANIITGYFIVRGVADEMIEEITDAADYDSYRWVKVNVDDAEKQKINQVFAWEGSVEGKAIKDGKVFKTISDTAVGNDTDDSESDGDPCVVLTPFALSSAGTVESNREGTEQVNEGDKDDGEDDDEECLPIPARHIANCHAARALQLTVLNAKAKMLRTQAAKRPCAAGAADKREHHDLSVGTSSQESQIPREDVLTISSKQTGIELEDYLLSPIVSTATPVIRYSSLNSQSLDWPPANQEAARRLQWPDLNDRDHAEDLDTRISAPSPRLYSPIHLPSDPEDTSILEAFDVFNGESLIRSAFVQEVEWRPDSFSEWIGSDDWPTIDEADPSTNKSQGWGQ
ncbi:hypothetical protein BGZ98_001511 [Dissophora globulifera]|nr:hypothetical protein BGZ98_001511 [Dissophora globulifera]